MTFNHALVATWSLDAYFMARNTETEGNRYHLEDSMHMQGTAHRLASLWTTVRTQLRDSRDAHASQAVSGREPASYSTSEVLDAFSTSLCHRI